MGTNRRGPRWTRRHNLLRPAARTLAHDTHNIARHGIAHEKPVGGDAVSRMSEPLDVDELSHTRIISALVAPSGHSLD